MWYIMTAIVMVLISLIFALALCKIASKSDEIIDKAIDRKE